MCKNSSPTRLTSERMWLPSPEYECLLFNSSEFFSLQTPFKSSFWQETRLKCYGLSGLGDLEERIGGSSGIPPAQQRLRPQHKIQQNVSILTIKTEKVTQTKTFTNRSLNSRDPAEHHELKVQLPQKCYFWNKTIYFFLIRHLTLKAQLTQFLLVFLFGL